MQMSLTRVRLSLTRSILLRRFSKHTLPADPDAGKAPGTVEVLTPQPAQVLQWSAKPAIRGSTGKLVPQIQFENVRQQHLHNKEHPHSKDTPKEGFNWKNHAVTLGACLLISAQLGVAFTWGNEASRMVGVDNECDILFEKLLVDPPADDKTNIIELLCQRFSRTTAYNDEVCRRVVAHPQVISRLCALTTSGSTKDIKIEAAKTLENVCGFAETRASIVQRGIHKTLIALLDAPSTPLVVRKSLAAALVSLSEEESNVPALAAAGAIGALHKTQQHDKLHRQRTDVALQEMCTSLVSQPGSVLPTDSQLVSKYAAEHAKELADPINRIRSPLVKSGLLLYLHTIAGGAAWGVGSALYYKQPWVGPMFRTALVTGLVPAFFVGGVVSLFQEYQRHANTEQDVFRLYAGTLFATMWPASYIMPAVDRWAPLWLGGHVVGFSSFFIYSWLTGSDLLKNDQQLLNEETAPPPLVDVIHQVRLARLEAKMLAEREAAEAAAKLKSK